MMSKVRGFLICALGLAAACPLESRADTLTSDTVWRQQDSPIQLTETMVVGSNTILRIEEGVTIHAASNASLIVFGSLRAEGSEASPILFTRNEAAETWPGIAFIGERVFDQVSCTGVLSYCSIEHASVPEWPLYAFSAGVAARFTDLSISNCTFGAIDGTVLRAEDSLLRVADCTFDHCGEGVNAVRCYALITDNRFSHIRNGADAIDIDMDWSGIEWKPALVQSNLVDGCSGDGIDLGGSAATVRGNQIRNCADKGISIGEGSNGLIENNEVSNCRVGIAIKDSSAPMLAGNTVTACTIGIGCYEKEPGMGGARGHMTNSIVRACGQNMMLDARSLLDIRDCTMEDGPFTNFASTVVINEILYCSASESTDEEFVELYNRGTTAVALNGWQLIDEVRFDFPDGTVLQPGAYLVIAANPTNFPGALGPWSGDLNDEAAVVRLVDSEQRNIDTVEYKTYGGWPAIAAGDGPSLELVQTDADNNNSENWAGSANIGGTPGAPNVPAEAATPAPAEIKVVINEIMYHPSSEDKAEEYIELYNASAVDLDLTGWQFTDGFGYPFPTGLVMAAGHYLVIAHDPVAVSQKYEITGVLGPFTSGKLANSGERLELRDASSNVVDFVEYQDRGTWPRAADGDGAALELLHPALDNNDPAFWAVNPNLTVLGSPGAANSILSPCTAAIRAATHYPVTPAPTEAVSVQARVEHAAAVQLFWKRDQDAVFNTLAMTNDGSGVYRATLPPQAHQTLVEYYIEAEDPGGERVVYPFGAPLFHLTETGHNVPFTLRYLSLNATEQPRVPAFRILMPSETRQELENHIFSDQLLPVTMIYMNEVFPFARLRYRGAMKRVWDVKSYRVDLTLDHPFADESKLNMNGKRPGPEWLATEYVRQRGLAVPLQQNIRLSINHNDQGPYLLAERIGKDYRERNFPGASDGEWNESWGETLTDSALRYPSAVSNALNTILSTPENDPAALTNAIDPEQWIRWLVCTVVLGDDETLLMPYAGNHSSYILPGSERVLLQPLDLDITWRSPQNGTMSVHMNDGTWDLGMKALDHFMRIPFFQRNYYQALMDELDTHFTAENLTEPITRYFGIVGSYPSFETSAGQALNYIAQRTTNLEAQVSALLQRTPAFQPELTAPHSGTVYWWPYADGSISGTVLPGTTAVQVNSSAGGVTLNSEAGTWTFETVLSEGDTPISVKALPLQNRNYATAKQTFTLRYDGADDDGDSLPNSWERFYGLDPNNGDPNSIHGANGDPDGDGLPNADEYALRTAPVEGGFLLPPTITGFAYHLPSEIILSWATLRGAIYQVQATDNLLAPQWENVGEAVTAQSSSAAVTLPEPDGESRFYRVILTEWPPYEQPSEN
ncbi:MAG: hypothetical protein GXY61_11255 [Lentisphaerae bacterium]|nr:hypothetical protein [Lentisphaerota bacterium]